MVLFAHYDDNGYRVIKLDSPSFISKMERMIHDAASRYIDSIIINYRAKEEIVFLQNDWTDDKNESPATLLENANTLRDSGKTSERTAIRARAA